MRDTDDSRTLGALRVVLDSSILIADFRLGGPMFREALSGLLQLGAEIVLPTIVMDEVINKYTELLRDKRDKLQKANEDAGRLLGRRLPSASFDIDNEVEAYRKWLLAELERFRATVAKYPAVSHESVVLRALSRRKPFDSEGRRGYRDALIWETVLELAASAGPDVILVTANVNDFAGADKALHAQLADEVKARGMPPTRVTLCDGLETLTRKHVATRLPSLRDIGSSLERGTLEGFDLEAWLENNLSGLLQDWDFTAVDLGFPTSYEDIHYLQITTVTAFSVPIVTQLSTSEVSCHIEVEVEAEFEFSISREDLRDILDRRRRRPSLSRFGSRDAYVVGYDSQTFQVRLVMTFDPTAKNVVEAEVSAVASA